MLGVPPRALSLNGRLGLAFGARGKGGKPMSEDLPIGYVATIVERLMDEDAKLRATAQRAVEETAKRAEEQRARAADAAPPPADLVRRFGKRASAA